MLVAGSPGAASATSCRASGSSATASSSATSSCSAAALSAAPWSGVDGGAPAPPSAAVLPALAAKSTTCRARLTLLPFALVVGTALAYMLAYSEL